MLIIDSPLSPLPVCRGASICSALRCACANCSHSRPSRGLAVLDSHATHFKRGTWTPKPHCSPAAHKATKPP